MKQRRIALHLAWIGLLFVAVAGVAVSAGVVVNAPAASLDNAPAIEPPAGDPPACDPGVADPPGTEDFTPVACRMEPQCQENSDCVAWCGPTGGHCVHHSCPIRICKCT